MIRLMKLLLVVFAVALVLALIAYKIDGDKQSESEFKKLFPAFSDQIDRASYLEIIHNNGVDKVIRLSFTRRDNEWGYDQHDDFPVKQSMINNILIGLANIEIIEPRTSNPKQYASLNLLPTQQLGGGIRFRVFDEDRHELVSLLLGKSTDVANLAYFRQRDLVRYDLKSTFYVRRGDETQSFLAQGNLPRESHAEAWFDKRLFHGDFSDIIGVVFGSGDDKIELMRKREDGQWTHIYGQQWESALSFLSLSGIIKPGEISFADAYPMRLLYADGTTITYKTVKKDAKIYAMVDIIVSDNISEAHRQDINDLQRRFANRILVFSSFANHVFRVDDDMLYHYVEERKRQEEKRLEEEWKKKQQKQEGQQ